MLNRVHRKPVDRSDPIGLLDMPPTMKRIRPRPIAISSQEAVAYRDTAPTMLVRVARNITDIVDGEAYFTLAFMRGTPLRQRVQCPFAKVGDVVYLPNEPHGDGRFALVDHAADLARCEARRVADNVRSRA
jgi:hypothetical protein